MRTLTQIFRNVRATAATQLSCACGVDLDQLATSVRSFVLQLGDEGRPSRVTHRLGEHSARKTFDVQIFDGGNSEGVNQPPTNFVVKIGALIADVCVRLLQQKHSLPAAVRTSLTTRYLVLGASQAALRFSVVAWVRNLCAVRQSSERRQSNVNANNFRTFRQGLRIRR